MLGYVVCYKPEMKVKDFELYGGYYCGVCKSIGSRYSQLPRMVLSYDAAFLALLLDSIKEEREDISREYCIVHHLKKKTIARNSSIDFAGDVMLLLAWYKLIDDAKDEGKVYAKALIKTMKGTHKKAAARQPKLDKIIGERLGSLSVLEDNKCANLDEAAETFAKVMEDIFIAGTKDRDINQVVLARLGYHLGKWIYLMDAFDDIEENIQSGAYNPLIYRHEFNNRESATEFKDRIRDGVELNLITYLSEMGKALDLLDIRKNKDIIENIIYVGLLNKMEEILGIKKEGETK